MPSKQTRLTFTPAERAFLNAAAGQPLGQPVSAATVLLALRQWATWKLGGDAGGLFLPRQRGANLRDVTPEQRRENVNQRWLKAKKGETMTIQQLAKMTDDQLFNWFTENARYNEKPYPFYSIRIGTSSRALTDRDTHKLFQKLLFAVNEIREA